MLYNAITDNSILMQLMQLIQLIKDSVFISDKSGFILVSNSICNNILGFDPAGDNILEILKKCYPDARKDLKEIIKNLNNIETYNSFTIILGKQHFDAIVSPFKGVNHDISLYICIARDLTHYIELEQKYDVLKKKGIERVFMTINSLNQKQKKLLALLLQNYPLKEIERILDIEERTMYKNKATLFRKFFVKNEKEFSIITGNVGLSSLDILELLK